MKLILRIGIVSLLALFTANTMAVAQNRGGGKARPSPNAAISQTIGTTVVSLTYGRPSLKGRSIENLVPPGKVWRTGANESTAITFSADVKVGDKAISAGTDSLYTIPGESEMTIIINSKMSWGTQYDEAQDVARTNVSMTNTGFAERFTITFDSLSDTKANMNLHWGEYLVVVPIEVQ
ncbi:MAG: DUF2911 domain-containing protein [Opitutales bacterium]|nr:DUF2911 domain-containing protein [Opitutales bacterium]